MVEAYDVKARKKVEIKDPKVVQLKNGRYAIKGTSSETGITVMSCLLYTSDAADE